MDPNLRALFKTGEGDINAKVDESVVEKHKGGDGGTFGVQESTQTRLRCFLSTFSLQ
jgi:hypothetical protein